MYKRVKKAKLGRKTSNRKALIKNQLRSLFESGHIVTTSPKAKELRRNAQSLIDGEKKNKGSIAWRRKLAITFGNNDKLVKEFVAYCEKEISGIRLIKVGFRKGDNGEKSRVELIGADKKKVKITPKTEKEVNTETKEVKKTEVAKTQKNVTKKLDKGIDRKAVVKKAERAKSRSGL